MNVMKTLPLAILGLLLLAGCGQSGGAGLGSGSTALQEAYDFCDDDNDGMAEHFQVSDEGHTLIVDGVMEQDDFSHMVCVLAKIKTPSSVTAQMDSTTAMMGRQTAEADGYTYEWSYHPDNGVDLIVTD